MRLSNRFTHSTINMFWIPFMLIGSTFPVYASLTGYEHETVRFVSFLVETHTSVIHAKDDVREQVLWQDIYLDLAQGRGVTRVIEGATKPANFSQPELTVVMTGDEVSQIDHRNHRVLVGDYHPATVESSTFLYAGRVYRGVMLADAIESASGEQITNENNGVRRIEFGDKSALHGVVITLDKQNHVRSLQDNERQYQCEWKQIESGGFWYVAHLRYSLELGIRRTVIEDTVHECRVYDSLPDAFFQPVYPESYRLKDLRKLLRPPSSLSK
ncbi:MAG: hypothetical protein GC154_17720 [bacterium]|nr:hypothetical protein [bacterium]